MFHQLLFIKICLMINNSNQDLRIWHSTESSLGKFTHWCVLKQNIFVWTWVLLALSMLCIICGYTCMSLLSVVACILSVVIYHVCHRIICGYIMCFGRQKFVQAINDTRIKNYHIFSPGGKANALTSFLGSEYLLCWWLYSVSRSIL